MKKMMLCYLTLLATLLLPTLSLAEESADWQKLVAPGAQHKLFEPFIGKWKNKGRWWMEPGATPQEIIGTTVNEWILGGRFMLAKNIGDATAGQPPFEGMGISGYDNLKQEFTSIWIDNMSTSIMSSTATYDAKKKRFVERGVFADAMSGEKSRPFTGYLKSHGRDRYTYEMHLTDKSGKEFKSLEISYQRIP